MKWYLIDVEMTQYYFSIGITGVLTDYYEHFYNVLLKLNQI